MPENAQIKVDSVDLEKVKDLAKDHINENTTLEIAYDIKIVTGVKEYEPTEFDENVQVTIEGLDTNAKEKYKVVHIDDENKTDEIKNVEIKDLVLQTEKTGMAFDIQDGIEFKNVDSTDPSSYRIHRDKDGNCHLQRVFKENGGEWPKHCVQGTEGANIYAPLLSVLSNRSFADKSAYCGKGLNKDCDQYSVFALDENNNITNSAGRIIYNEIKDMSNLEIDVCGIAGDVCVLNTLKDLVNLVGPGCLQVLEKYTASLDDGLTLMNYCVTNNIKYTR